MKCEESVVSDLLSDGLVHALVDATLLGEQCDAIHLHCLFEAIAGLFR